MLTRRWLEDIDAAWYRVTAENGPRRQQSTLQNREPGSLIVKCTLHGNFIWGRLRSKSFLICLSLRHPQPSALPVPVPEIISSLSQPLQLALCQPPPTETQWSFPFPTLFGSILAHSHLLPQIYSACSQIYWNSFTTPHNSFLLRFMGPISVEIGWCVSTLSNGTFLWGPTTVLGGAHSSQMQHSKSDVIMSCTMGWDCTQGEY